MDTYSGSSLAPSQLLISYLLVSNIDLRALCISSLAEALDETPS